MKEDFDSVQNTVFKTLFSHTCFKVSIINLILSSLKRNFSLIVLRNYHKRYFPRKVKKILILIWILINLSLDFAKFNLFIDKTAFPCRVQGKKKNHSTNFWNKEVHSAYVDHAGGERRWASWRFRYSYTRSTCKEMKGSGARCI